MEPNSEGIPNNVAIGIPTEDPESSDVSMAQAAASAGANSQQTMTSHPHENDANREGDEGCASGTRNLEGTTIFFPAPGDDAEPDDQLMSKQQCCEESGLSNSAPFADNRLESTGKSKPMKIEDLGKKSNKLYNISCIKHKGSFSQASGPGAYSVHTANTGAESLSNANPADQSNSRRQTPVVSEDPPLRFWRDESNTSGGSSARGAMPFRNTNLIDAEATLVKATINNLYPPVQVNSYGRPRRMSSSQQQHRFSFSQQQKEVESDKDSQSGIAEAKALTSNGVVLLCLKTRKGYLLVLAALLLVVGLVVGLVLSLTGGKREVTGNSLLDAPLNKTLAPSLVPSWSPSSVPTQAPAMPFGVSVLPEPLQQSLLDPTSPQSMAMEWMLEDPKYWSEIPLERKLQRYALVAIYYSTTGDTWVDSKSWLNHNASECDWFSGVQGGKRPCNAATELVRLVLPSNDLKGSLPPEIELLSNIQELDLSGNQELQGSIPSTLWEGDLASNLRSLDLSHTGLAGSLPADKLASWSQLSSLNLENMSSFEGGLPTEIGLLSSLQDLTLESTRLSGTIPSQVGHLSTLTSLTMRHCHLTEAHPTELGRLSRLENLDLGENAMSGTIPSEIGLMTSLHLIAVDNSFLSGTIPSQVGLMRRIRTFNVFGNRLTGTIPSELFSATSLQWLFLNQNRLRGAIPTEIGQLSQLLWLVAWENQLSGTLPTELQSNTALSLLSLATNPLTGTIPTELFTVTSLEWLFLGWSSLSGTFPTEVGQLTNLAGLHLNAANLVGTIPSQVGELRHHLTDLWIDRQAAGLTGTLPSELGTMQFLSHLKASNNRLNGTLPVEITELASVETLNLSHNELSGTLPIAMDGMAQLTVLDLQDNFLTGLVPTEELASCPFLRELYLRNNSLSGELPNELCVLNALEFDCSQALCGCQCACHTGQ